MLPALIVGLVALAPRPLNFYADAPYDTNVPRPEAILGYGPGERHTTFREQEQVVLSIASKAQARVRVVQYGKSPEGRPLRVFVISNEDNITRIEGIRRDLRSLANPSLPAEELQLIKERTPAVVWINQCIHGNEPASFESAMWLLYNLAASRGRRITSALDETVVILNPVYNPDGHERFAVYQRSIATGSPEPGAYEQFEPGILWGRTNHYRFDMNRDRVAMSQDETRQEVAEFLRWNPQVYVDQHGQTSNYFFPPNPMSINPNVDRARINKWAEIFGRATARAFDARGWTYFTKDVFDLYYPGYLDSWVSLSGAVGMTHETDGGKPLAKKRADGSILTLRDGVEKHFESALTVIRSTAQNREALMTDYVNFKQRAVSGAHAGNFKRVVVVSSDPRPLVRLQQQLARSGINSAFAAQPFRQPDAHSYWTGGRESRGFSEGSLIIDMAQSQGPVAKALLEPKTEFESEFVRAQREKRNTAPEGETYPGPEEPEFYDLTGWSLPYAHHLKAWWCESAPAVETLPTPPGMTDGDAALRPSTVGYALVYRDQDDILAAYDILRDGVRGLVTTKPIQAGRRTYPRGTFIFLAARNEEGYERALVRAGVKRRVTFERLTTSYPEEGREGPGSGSVQALKRPNIAVVFGRGGEASGFGPIWYLMERTFDLPFTPLRSDALGGDLSKYTAIVFPSGSGATATGKLREWVQEGGCAVVLEQPGWAIGANGFVALDSRTGTSLPGALFRAQMDPRSFISYGYEAPEQGRIELAVPIAGSTFYAARRAGGSAVTIPGEGQLLSGWDWQDTKTVLAGTAWLQDAPLGRGRAVIFTQDPTERAMWPGLNKMLLNAMLLGPGT